MKTTKRGRKALPPAKRRTVRVASSRVTAATHRAIERQASAGHETVAAWLYKLIMERLEK